MYQQHEHSNNNDFVLSFRILLFILCCYDNLVSPLEVQCGAGTLKSDTVFKKVLSQQ